MTVIRRMKSVGPKPSGNSNRITVELGDGTVYTVNQNTLNRFKTAEEIKAALEKFLGYPVPDVHFHKNRNGTWAMAWGETPPTVWPEDEVAP